MFVSMFIYRLGHRAAMRHASTRRPYYRVLIRLLTVAQKLLVYYPLKLELPFAAHVGVGLGLPHPHNIVINSRVSIGANCRIFHGVTLGESLHAGRACPQIEDDVTIGAGAILLGGIVVGRGTVVGAGSVITRSVPSGQIVVGSNRLLGRRGAT